MKDSGKTYLHCKINMSSGYPSRLVTGKLVRGWDVWQGYWRRRAAGTWARDPWTQRRSGRGTMREQWPQQGQGRSRHRVTSLCAPCPGQGGVILRPRVSVSRSGPAAVHHKKWEGKRKGELSAGFIGVHRPSASSVGWHSCSGLLESRVRNCPTWVMATKNKCLGKLSTTSDLEQGLCNWP